MDTVLEIKAHKERERQFREGNTPYGEHVAASRSPRSLEIEMRNIVRFLSIHDGEAVLDVGCADGRFLEYLHGRTPRCRLFGSDFARSPLLKMRIKPFETHAACADACDLPFKRGAFPRIVSIQVLQQIPTRMERLRALRDIHGILRPGGSFVLTVLNRPTWRYQVINGKEGPLVSSPLVHVYLYDARELANDLQSAGYVVKRIAGINNLPSSYLRNLGVAGIAMDLLITRFFTSLSLKKGSYLLAECIKADSDPRMLAK